MLWVADHASLMILVGVCFPRDGLSSPLLVLIVVSGILLACYAVNGLGLRPAIMRKFFFDAFSQEIDISY